MSSNEFNASAAPPDSDATTISTGASDGFTNGSAWDVIASKGLLASDLADFLNEVDQEPAFRAAATLQALSRVREALQGVDELADVKTPVEVHLQDLALLSRQLLARLR